MYPTKRVWHSIYNNIHPGRKWPSIAMCIVLISILLLVGYLNTSNTNTTLATINTIKSTPVNLSINTTHTNEAGFYNLFIDINASGDLAATTDPANITSSTYTFGIPVYEQNNTALITTPGAVVGTTGNSSVVLVNGNYEVIPQSKNAVERSLVSTGKTMPANKNTLVNNNTSRSSVNNTRVITTAGSAETYEPASVVAAGDAAIIIPQTGGALSQKINAAILPGNGTGTNNSTTTTTKNTTSQNVIIAGDDGNVVIENNDIEALKTIPVKVKGIVAGKEDNKTPAAITAAAISENNVSPASKAALKKDNAAVANTAMVLSNTDKAWVDNYALYNRPVPKKWAGKLGWQLYITPSVVYRNLKNIVPGSIDINKEVAQHPSVGLEIGGGIIYPIFKGVRIKTGLQFNFTRYNTDAFENSHPVATSITLNDEGQYYHASRTTPFSNNGGITPVKLHNDTYQLSIPIGLDFKILGNDNLQWNVGTTIQPAYVFGGKSYLISSDKRNFIKETSLLNRWNLDAGFETFISYKVDGFTFQVGPQFRKQIFTTNTKMYTVEEKLNNYGIKFGITKLIK